MFSVCDAVLRADLKKAKTQKTQTKHTKNLRSVCDGTSQANTTPLLHVDFVGPQDFHLQHAIDKSQVQRITETVKPKLKKIIPLFLEIPPLPCFSC